MEKDGQGGFTLIELSIVLVIIGLLAGGIFIGGEMIKSAQRRRLISEYQQVTSAIDVFALKYSSTPGDTRLATRYWGTASGGCPYGARTGTQTCDGNGDGNIGVNVWDTTESFNFWQHLANADLIKGQYTGQPGTPDLAAPNINVFTSTSYQNTGFSVRYAEAEFTAVCNPLLTYNCDRWSVNLMYIGRTASNCGFTGWYSWCPFLSPTEASDIDGKVDDGLPASGSFEAYPSAINPGCTTSDDRTLARYNTATNSETPLCSFMVRLNW